MVLKYFNPNEDYSWEELDAITAKGKDLWTWPTASFMWLKNKGCNLKIITPFEYELFIKNGGDFLIEKYGKEVGEAQIAHSNIAQEQQLAKQLLNNVPIEKRIPALREVRQLLQEGYLILCNVNSLKLNNQEGYAGHSVVIKGMRDNQLILHDPGLPPFENRIVSFDNFLAAWAYPNEEAKEIYAIKK